MSCPTPFGSPTCVGENNGISDVPGAGPLDPQDTRYYCAGANNQYSSIADSDDLYGTDQSDLIFGESGNNYINSLGGSDVLYGGSGNDTIYGGDGSDTLLGGLGNDTYYIYASDTGQDTIEDKDGTNTVVMNGVALKFFYKDPQSGYYVTPDKRFKAEKSGTDLIITDQTTVGNKVTLNKDFADGDFGIKTNDQFGMTVHLLDDRRSADVEAICIKQVA